jgi:hypothetical protein
MRNEYKFEFENLRGRAPLGGLHGQRKIIFAMEAILYSLRL